jgi:hypothetical protein
MAFPEGGERPRDELTPFRQTQLTPGEQERSHAKLVAACQNLIQYRQQELGEHAKYFPPAKMIKDVLVRQSLRRESSQPAEKQYGEACHTLLLAWDVIAFEHYGTTSTLTEVEDKEGAVDRLEGHYLVTEEPIIRLSEQQTRLLDAMAEAANIPHRKGQAEIEIPEPLRNYKTWRDEFNKREQR